MKWPLLFLSIASLTMSTRSVAMDDAMDLCEAPQSYNGDERCLYHWDKKDCFQETTYCRYCTAEFNFILMFNIALCSTTQSNIDNLKRMTSDKALNSGYIIKNIQKSESEKDLPKEQRYKSFFAIAQVRPYLICQMRNKRSLRADYAHEWINVGFIIPFAVFKDGSRKFWMELFIDAINENKNKDINIDKIQFWLKAGYNPHYRPTLPNKTILLNLYDMIIQQITSRDTQNTLMRQCNEAISTKNDEEKKIQQTCFIKIHHIIMKNVENHMKNRG